MANTIYDFGILDNSAIAAAIAAYYSATASAAVESHFIVIGAGSSKSQVIMHWR